MYIAGCAIFGAVRFFVHNTARTIILNLGLRTKLSSLSFLGKIA